jgi:hypothetical protein
MRDQHMRELYVGGRGNAVARRWARWWTAVIPLGLMPRRIVTLEVLGRATGVVRRFPLVLADVDGRWYAVSMLGDCNWVRNVRAADGRAVLRRVRSRPVQLVEVPVARRPAILTRFVQKAPGGRPHVPVDRRRPVEDFAAVAERYPVFEVTDRPA